MAELADAYGSGPYGATRGGSSPLVSNFLDDLQATEQIQNQNDYENGYDYAVRPVAESITACRESPD